MFNAIIRWSLNNKLLIVVATAIFLGTSIYLMKQMACFIPGHYEANMKGEIIIK